MEYYEEAKSYLKERFTNKQLSEDDIVKLMVSYHNFKYNGYGDFERLPLYIRYLYYMFGGFIIGCLFIFFE